MNYKISVIIPVYNAENTLNRAIESILNQNWEGNFEKDIEIILIDDHSDDRSLSIIKGYSNKYPNIIYFSFENNSGFGGRGRNKGIELSSGEFIILMDNDDIYLPNAFKILYNAIITENADFVSSNYINDNLKKNKIHCPKKYNYNMTLNPTENQHRWDIVATSGSMGPWAKIYRKEFLNNNSIHFLENTQFDDAEFYINCLLHAKRYHILPNDFVYRYYTYESSQIRSYNKNNFEAMFNTIRGIDTIIRKNDLKSNKVISHHLKQLLLVFSNLKEKNLVKKDMLNRLYEFESTFEEPLNFNQIELNYLNKLIMQKKFTYAIIISKIYSIFYNNITIRKLYNIYNNKKIN